MRTAEHGDSAGYRSPSTGVGSEGPTERKCRPRKGIARENPALRPARDAVSVRLFRQHTQGSAIRGTGLQLRRGSCHRSGQPRNTRGGERGMGEGHCSSCLCLFLQRGRKARRRRSHSLSAAAADGPAPTFPSRRRGILPRGFLCDNVYGLIP